MTFSNHGCDRSYNYGDEYSSVTESTVDLTDNKIPDGLDCTAIAYSPLQERHLRQIMSAGDVILKDIRAGDEILVSIIVPKFRTSPILDFSTNSFQKVNYVTFADPNEWIDDISRLKDQCNGKGVGEVSEYELGA